MDKHPPAQLTHGGSEASSGDLIPAEAGSRRSRAVQQQRGGGGVPGPEQQQQLLQR